MVSHAGTTLRGGLRTAIAARLSAEGKFERDGLIWDLWPDPPALPTMKPHEAIMLHRLQRSGQIGCLAAGTPGQLLK